MLATLTNAWNDFWFRPEERINLVAARVIVAINALWILLSRPQLPDLFRWPSGFWSHVDLATKHRYLIFPIGATGEWIAFVALLLALAAAVFGFARRTSCFVAGVLIYHFAPLEDIFSADAPYFRGLGVPALALLILAFADDPKSPRSPEYRWPLKLIQLLFAFTYFFSGIAKLFVPGIRTWISSQHFLLIVTGRSSPDAFTPWSSFFVEHPSLAPIAAIGVLALDLLLITMVFIPRAAWVFVPSALLMHLLAPRIIGVVFLNAPLLLLFIDWSSLRIQFRHAGNKLRS
jgi:hypothetical protein